MLFEYSSAKNSTSVALQRRSPGDEPLMPIACCIDVVRVYMNENDKLYPRAVHMLRTRFNYQTLITSLLVLLKVHCRPRRVI